MQIEPSLFQQKKRSNSMIEEKLYNFVQHRPALMILLVSVWFGLATGLGEGILQSAKKLIRHQDRILFYNPDVTWMIPLSHVITFSILGFLLFISAKFLPRFFSLRLVIGLFLFLGFVSIMLQFPRLDRRAILILAAGLAFQISKLGEKYSEKLSLIMIRTIGLLILLIAFLSVISRGILE